MLFLFFLNTFKPFRLFYLTDYQLLVAVCARDLEQTMRDLELCTRDLEIKYERFGTLLWEIWKCIVFSIIAYNWQELQHFNAKCERFGTKIALFCNSFEIYVDKYEDFGVCYERFGIKCETIGMKYERIGTKHEKFGNYFLPLL